MPSKMRRVPAAIAAVALLAVPALSLADNLVQDVGEVTINGNKVDLAQISNGGSVDVKYKINATGSDCDIPSGKSVKVSLSIPTGVSATGTTLSTDKALSFSSCNEIQTVTFGSSTAGDHSIAASIEKVNFTTGDFKNEANFILRVGQAATGTTPTPPPGDSTAPVIAYSLDPSSADGNAGWYRSNVSLTWTVTEEESPTSLSKTGCVDQRITSDQAATTYSCSATSTGGSATEVRVTIKRDATAPTVNPGNVTDTTWRNTPRAETFTASDPGGSGLLAGQDLDANNQFSLRAAVESTRDAGGNVLPTVASKTISDEAGNSTTRSVSAWIDLTPPSVGVTDTNAATFDVCTGTAPTKPVFSPSDALSGVNPAAVSESWTSTTSASGVGSWTYSAHAADNATNSDSYGPKTYKIVYGGAYGGVRQPINSDGSSRFKLGSTVPVKFQLMCGVTPVSNAVANLTVKMGDTTPDPGVDEVISTSAATTGNLFRYDGTGEQYIFNLSTKSGYVNPGATTATPFSQGTWTLGINLDDGTSRTIKIQLVK